MRDLDENEIIVRDTIREVYAGKLTSDEVAPDETGDMYLNFRVADCVPFASASMNISGLARKYRQGLPLENLKAAVWYGPPYDTAR